MSQTLVGSGYPELPFFVVDHGIDANRSVTLKSGTQLNGSTVLPQGTILQKTGTRYQPVLSGSGAAAAGILFHRADTSLGDKIVAMFVHGVVREDALSANSVGTVAGGVAAAKAALTGIQFV